jgi:hypothetical protein
MRRLSISGVAAYVDRPRQFTVMRFQQSIDSLPIVGFFLAFIVVALLASEAGYRLGYWWQTRTSNEKEGSTPMIVGSLLTLVMVGYHAGLTFRLSDRYCAA